MHEENFMLNNDLGGGGGGGGAGNIAFLNKKGNHTFLEFLKITTQFLGYPGFQKKKKVFLQFTDSQRQG